VAYVRLPTPPNPWHKPAPKKQQQQKQQQPIKQEGQEQQEQQEGNGGQQEPGQQQQEQPGASSAPAAAGAKAQPPAAQRQQQQQQLLLQQDLPPGYAQMTAKQRRQVKRRQELAARAAERDSWTIARAACLALVQQNLSLQGSPLAFDAAMGQVRVWGGLGGLRYGVSRVDESCQLLVGSCSQQACCTPHRHCLPSGLCVTLLLYSALSSPQPAVCVPLPPVR
jgi:hypothetical protein